MTSRLLTINLADSIKYMLEQLRDSNLSKYIYYEGYLQPGVDSDYDKTLIHMTSMMEMEYTMIGIMILMRRTRWNTLFIVSRHLKDTEDYH